MVVAEAGRKGCGEAGRHLLAPHHGQQQTSRPRTRQLGLPHTIHLLTTSLCSLCTRLAQVDSILQPCCKPMNAILDTMKVPEGSPSAKAVAMLQDKLKVGTRVECLWGAQVQSVCRGR